MSVSIPERHAVLAPAQARVQRVIAPEDQIVMNERGSLGESTLMGRFPLRATLTHVQTDAQKHHWGNDGLARFGRQGPVRPAGRSGSAGSGSPDRAAP